MKQRISILLLMVALLVGGQQLLAQSTTTDKIDRPDKTEKADGEHRNFSVTTTQDAAYPGGQQALYMDLFQRMQYPEAAKAEKVTGDITVSFYVETDSTTSDVRAMNDLGHGTAAEAERLIKATKFAPAIQNGKPVRQQMMLPVLFRIYD